MHGEVGQMSFELVEGSERVMVRGLLLEDCSGGAYNAVGKGGGRKGG